MNHQQKVEKALRGVIRELKRARLAERERLVAALEADQNITSALLARLAEVSDELETTIASGSLVAQVGPATHVRTDNGSRRDTFNKRRNVGGSYTPTKQFRIPIMKALDTLGGTGKSSDVMKLVEKSMELKAADYKMIRGDRPVPRWQNTIGWVRHDMTNEGLINLDPKKRGQWILTSAGRQILLREGFTFTQQPV